MSVCKLGYKSCPFYEICEEDSPQQSWTLCVEFSFYLIPAHIKRFFKLMQMADSSNTLCQSQYPQIDMTLFKLIITYLRVRI